MIKTPILANHNLINVKGSVSGGLKTASSLITSHEASNTKTIILDLDKYKINEKKTYGNSNTNNSNNNNNRIMVNSVPQAPKKYHTFNENNNQTSKESTSKENGNDNQQLNEIKDKDIFGNFNKPLMRTGSNINNNNNLLRNGIRRPPKDFLVSGLDNDFDEDIKVSNLNKFDAMLNNKQYLNENNSNMNITKSLPSYDEAMKRVSGDLSNSGNKQNNTKISTLPNGLNDSNKIAASSSSYVPSNSSSASNSNYGNGLYKGRNALPNFPIQSTFKSLLSIPINSSQTKLNNLNSNETFNNTNKNSFENNGAKVYFRPHDLTNNSNKNRGSLEDIFVDNSNNNKNKYTTQKSSTERLFNGLPVSITPILTTTNRVSSSVGTARKVVLSNNGNTSPSLSRRSRQPSPQCENNVNDNNVPTRPSSSLNTNENTTNNNKTSTATIYLNTNGRCSVTPISINNNILTESSSPTNTLVNYSSSAKATLVKTSTTTTEQVDTIVRRIQSPVEDCVEEIMTYSKKPQNNLKSWPSFDRLTNSGTMVFDNHADNQQQEINMIKINNNRDKTPIPMNRSSSSQSNHNNANFAAKWKSNAQNSNLDKQADLNINTNYTTNNIDPSKNQSREAYSITGSSNVNSFESNLNNNIINNDLKSNSSPLNYNDNQQSNHVNHIINKFNSFKDGKITPTSLFRANNNELIKKKESTEQYDYNISLIKSGKLLDAISAASNSIENGLGPVLVKKSKSTKSNKNSNSSFSTKLNKFNKDLTKSNSNESDSNNNIKLVNNRINVISSSSNVNEKKYTNHHKSNKTEKNNETSISFSSEKSLSLIENKNDENDKLGKIYSGLNDARIVFKPSSSSDTQNTNTQKQIVENQQLPNRKAQSIDPSLERPPCRLNYYDSDTNTFSEGLFGAELHKKSSNRNINRGRELLTDSPNLSNITEGKFDEVEGGHRTSTPNTSKFKQSSNVTSPELKNIKQQLDSLEKMYFEILKIIDTDKRSLYSESENQSTTSISSFTPSLSEYKLNNDKKNEIKKSKSQRSSSFANRNQLIQSVAKENNEIKNLKTRFNRLETQLVSLAKTVAQISVEVKSIKSIEDTLQNLRNDIHNLKNYDSSNKLSEKHISDPNLFNKSVLNEYTVGGNNEITSAHYNINTKNYNTVLKSYESRSEYSSNNFLNRRQDLINDKERFKTYVPSYSNPKKLKKLTKFFGQEPPILRMFLQKLNYENYAQNFENEHITITELPYLSEERLKSLGIPLGPRLRILQEAQNSFRHEIS